MKRAWLIGIILIGCTQPVSTDDGQALDSALKDQEQFFLRKISALKHKIDELEDQCNPYTNQLKNCDQWVIDRWNADNSCPPCEYCTSYDEYYE